MTTANYGRIKNTVDSGWVGLTPNTSAATCYDRSDDDIWGIGVYFWGGRTGGTQPQVRVAVYDTDASKNPTTRVAYMAHVKPTTSMVSAGNGSQVFAPIEQADNAPTNTAFMIRSGKRYLFDFLTDANGLGLSIYPGTFPTIDNPRLYTQNAPGDPQPTTYASYISTNNIGQITAYVLGIKNEAPLIPVTGLAPSGTVTSTTPTFTADFRDNNGTYGGTHSGVNTGDRLNQYKIQVRQVGGSTLFWNQTFNATPDEQTADAVSQVYNGTALVRGTQYEWRVRMSDQFDAWSDDYSAWTSFTPQALGFVTLDGSPSGKILTNTPSFDGRWNHQAATSMTNVQVRLLSPSGTVLQDTGTKVKAAVSSALPGTLFTVSWAQTGFTNLAWGRNYKYIMRGYDGSQWSDWSAARTFNTDAAPRIASNLSPSTSQNFSTPPKLTFSLSDPDDDYTGTLTAFVYIVGPLGTTTFPIAATYNTATSKWEYQVLVTDLVDGYGGYTWFAYGYDGTLYSGGSTLLSGRTDSSGGIFYYVAGPVVAISSPAYGATVVSSSLTVTWSVTSGGPQAKYQVTLYKAGTTTVAYQSQVITSTGTSHTIPSGYLTNGLSYDAVVAVTNSTPVTGNSAVATFAVAYPTPTSVANFQVTTVPIGNDPFDTAVRLTWDQTGYAAPDFQNYTIYRSANGGPDEARIVLDRVYSPSTLQYLDPNPASGYEYTYEITVTILVGLDELESATTFDTATVTLQGTVLTLMGDATTYRACLLNVTDRSYDRQIQETVYQSPASTKPVTARSAARYWVGSFSGVIFDDAMQPAEIRGSATAKERWDEFDALDAQQGTVCIRDGYGRKEFVKITALKPTDQKPGNYGYSFSTRSERAQEGIV